MRKLALRGFWATCVCAALSSTASYAAPPDVVLYAADATRLTGNWARVADSTAAGGQLLSGTDKGWQSPDSALAQPADSLEFTFNAESATAYHVWVRMRATSNSKFNDSLFAQFSDAVTGTGAPLFRIGTTSALTLNLQTSNGAKLNGWGWVDGAYWLNQLSTVSFSATGAHTLRLQTREDGAKVDQVVLSPATYLTVSPGQRSGDSTIIARPSVTPTPLPTPYSGVASALPGTIQAEDFDNGGEGAAYHDPAASTWRRRARVATTSAGFPPASGSPTA